MREIIGLLIFGYLMCSYQVSGDWLSETLANVDRMNQRLNADIHRMNKEINENVQAQVARANENVAFSLKNVDRELERIPKTNVNSGTSIINLNNGQTLITSGNGGTSRKINSGVDANGNPFHTESEDLILGNTLFHTDRVYNYTTKTLDETKYRLDLSDPNAKPVYFNVTSAPT